MNFLWALRSSRHLFCQLSAIRQLCREGHTVRALFGQIEEGLGSQQVLRDFQEELDGTFTFDDLQRRNDAWRKPLLYTRELINYANYLRLDGQSPYYLERWERESFPGWMRRIIRRRVSRHVLSRPWAQDTLKSIERAAPPEPAIARWLDEFKPDAVVAAPVIMRFSEEIEYLKAARALNIPTVVPVLSWDNLTTKGVFQIFPDVLLVWNRQQFDEAVNFHRLPAERVVVSGGPMFDWWLDFAGPTLDRETFCRQAGLDPARPFIVYLGSSANIAADETWLVEELAGALKDSPNAALKDMRILVRPHPANSKHYQKLSLDNARVWPPDGGLPHTPEAREGFYNTLYHAVAAVGLNTSGMIDSIVADKPCLAIVTERYEMTQARALHFQALMLGEAIEQVKGSAAYVEAIAALAAGRDGRAENRRRFVEEFIRPAGYQRPAGPIVARAIRMAAERRPAADIGRDLFAA